MSILDKISIKTTCPFCGNIHYVVVNGDDYNNYLNGELVQKAFPYLSADDRELLITGICNDCWNNTFK